jgi:hypothetical protein
MLYGWVLTCRCGKKWGTMPNLAAARAVFAAHNLARSEPLAPDAA